MRIIAVDPGYDRLGVAVLEKDSTGKEVLLFSDCITTERNKPFEKRLFEVTQAFEKLSLEYAPRELAIEKLFFKNNQKTGMFVSQVIGALSYVSQKMDMLLFEYTPLEIKTAVTGSGRSGKQEIIKMVPRIIHCEKISAGTPMLDDEYDAIAVGITHFSMRIARSIHRS